jgi:hypothetical protein
MKLTDIVNDDQFWEKVCQVARQVKDQVENETHNQIWSQVFSQFWKEVKVQVSNNNLFEIQVNVENAITNEIEYDISR